MSMIHLFEKNTNYFVETGCFYGFGIEMAIQSQFKFIYSIELSEKFYEICKHKFSNFPDIHIILGDSGLILNDVISKIDEPITFWLDGHFSGGDTALGVCNYPILQELEQISRHKIKNHSFYIDDVRLWKEFDQNLNLNNVISTIQRINPNYDFYLIDGGHEDKIFTDDILVCKI